MKLNLGKYFLGLLLLVPLTVFAHIISITATSPFPSTVLPSSTKYATYTVTNISSRANITVVDESNFPANSGLSIFSSTCGSPMGPAATCIIRLQLIAPATAQTISAMLQEWAKPTADGVTYPINVNISSSVTNFYAYITNSGNNSISLCLINGSLLLNCSNAQTITGPLAITINNNRLYVGAGNNVYVCVINTSDGAITNCASTGGGLLTNNAYGLAFNPLGTIVYAIQQSLNQVYYCSVNAGTGTLSNCTPTGSGFSNPAGIVISPNGNFAYITNQTANTVSVCSVNTSTGALSNCITTGTGFVGPFGITLNNSGTLAYIVNNTAQNVSICAVNSNTGALSNCTTSGSNFNSPAGITINSTGNLAYIADQGSNVVTVCSISSTDGSLNNCATTGTRFNSPIGVAIY